jgi:quinol monooxygenase YgiN
MHSSIITSARTSPSTPAFSHTASHAPEARVALLVRLEAKPGKQDDVARLLQGGLSVVREEHGTPYWFALQLGQTSFGIFDAFPDDPAREAHLAGRLAAALMAQAPDLLATAPVIERVDILATKDAWQPSLHAGTIRVGLLARLEARAGKEHDVARLLASGVAVVADEPGTPIWFGIQLAPATFGIFDAFVDDASRNAHLEGRLAQTLMARAPELLAMPPAIERVDVLASKLPR